MDTDNANQAGSEIITLDSIEAADYDFTIGAVLSEAWEKTSGLKGSFWAAAGVFILVIITLSVVVGMGSAFLLDSSDMAAGTVLSMVLQLVIMAVMYPFAAGVIMLGVERSVDLPISYTSVFSYFSYTLPLLGVAVLSSLFISIGFLLLIIPGVYLSLAYIFAVPLIVNKNMGVWEAMETSRKAVTSHWFKLFFLFLLMAVIVLISALPFGLGLIWTYPMSVAALGIMFRDIFGVDVDTSIEEV